MAYLPSSGWLSAVCQLRFISTNFCDVGRFMKKDWQSKPNILVRGLIKLVSALGYTYARVPVSFPRECNLCGYSGNFRYSGLYAIRPDALCMSCWSTDRERLFAIYVDRSGWTSNNKEILHFAPEPRIVKLLKPVAKRYLTADLFSERADVDWNIEQIPAEGGSFDAVICSHVLEHVDTEKALREIHRVLRPGGRALLMIPIEEALEKTYTDATITTEDERYLHFHQPDHVRIIGRDFMDQVRAAGFLLEEFLAHPRDIVKHGLQIGEKVFVAVKPSQG